jgi:hypothetical protein
MGGASTSGSGERQPLADAASPPRRCVTLEADRPAPHDTRMRLLYASAVLCLAVILVLAVVARPEGRPRVTGPAGEPSAAGSLAAAALPGLSDDARRLDAVRTVKLFCDLVDSGRLWPAAALFATPRVWPRRELRAVRRLEFLSASVDFAPDPHTLVVVARVRASGRAASPVPDGDATLFFTLGRVGTATGGWLITAVTASP